MHEFIKNNVAVPSVRRLCNMGCPCRQVGSESKCCWYSHDLPAQLSAIKWMRKNDSHIVQHFSMKNEEILTWAGEQRGVSCTRWCPGNYRKVRFHVVPPIKVWAFTISFLVRLRISPYNNRGQLMTKVTCANKLLIHGQPRYVDEPRIGMNDVVPDKQFWKRLGKYL